MAGLTTAGRNLMLDSGFAPAYASIHSADPDAEIRRTRDDADLLLIL